ncbi:MAG TPA: hypothetical protein VL995_21135 [Cellvibrio sp.]|nr:hypothetical protein [Cellvibrio sp.]
MMELNQQQRAIIDYLIETTYASASRSELEGVIIDPESFDADVMEMHEARIVEATFTEFVVQSNKGISQETRKLVRHVSYTAIGAKQFGC